MREAFVKQMEEELCHVGVTLTEKQMEQFFRYYELLNEWNHDKLPESILILAGYFSI